MERSILASFLHAYYVEILAILPITILLAGLSFIVGIDPYLSKKYRRIMLNLCILVFSLVVQNFVDNLLATGRPNIMLRRIASAYGYTARPVIPLLFLAIVSPQKERIWEWSLIGINASLYVISIFAPICFEIDVNNHYRRGLPVFGHSCLITSLILLGLLLYRTIRAFSQSRRKETWLPIYVTLLIFLALLLDDNVGSMSQPVSFLTIFTAIGCAVYYIWLHLQFVREHENALLMEQRVQLMLSQIKPHFLYNALGAIEELCIDNPPAREATEKFSEYLRGNMNSLSAEGPVPFEQELSHVRLYMELEQLRFEDAIQVKYDICSTSFCLPALTLEPIVENAVRHGIRSKPGGRGTVTISSRETPGYYEISVEDDGIGFDPDVMPDDGQLHVGIQNVRERLRSVCGGDLQIVSVKGQGTRATIRIPKAKE